MTLKDWKKYENKSDSITWKNTESKTKDNWLKIHIDGWKPEKYGWTIVVTDRFNYPFEHGKFDTKAQALKFAKNYMKTH